MTNVTERKIGEGSYQKPSTAHIPTIVTHLLEEHLLLACFVVQAFLDVANVTVFRGADPAFALIICNTMLIPTPKPNTSTATTTKTLR
jgi:hypothetical protein